MGPQLPRGPRSWLGRLPGGSPDPHPAFAASGRLRLVVLPEDRLQMKWRESEGSSLGYLVQVKPRAGRGPRLPSARTDGDHGQHGGRWARLLATLPPSSPTAPLTRGGCGRRAGPVESPPPYPRAWRTQKVLAHLEETRIDPFYFLCSPLKLPKKPGVFFLTLLFKHVNQPVFSLPPSFSCLPLSNKLICFPGVSK